MWIFTQHGFFSVVRGNDTLLADGSSQPTVQIRARHREHIDELQARFQAEIGAYPVVGYDDPEHEEEFRYRDYEYRIFVPEPVWQDLGKSLACDVTYSNFKGQVYASGAESRLSETPYEQQLYRVYHTMERQDR
jgi:hypothetical protein